MHSTIYPENTPQASLNEARLTRLNRWWYSLMPPAIQKFLPPWPISVGLTTLVAFSTQDPWLSTILGTTISMFWASMAFTWLFVKLREYIGRWKWLISTYHALLALLVATPAMAQEQPACTSTGLMSAVTNFVSQLFSTITFGGLGGGTLSTLFCQVIGFITLGILLGFIAAFGVVSYRVGIERQPITTAVDPLMAFLIFAGTSTIAIGVMIGTPTTT